MIEDWYFCSRIGADPHTTHVFLDILDCLRSTAAELPLQIASFEELATLQPAIRRYALLPVIEAGLGAGDARSGEQRPEVAAAARREVEHALEAVDRTIRVAGGQAIEALFTRSPGEDVVAHLATAAGACLGRSAQAPSDRPYLDTEEFTAEILLLSAALPALRQAPNSVDAFCSRDELRGLVRRAVDGRFGRRAFVLAVGIIAFTGDLLLGLGELLGRLSAPDVGVLPYEPDLLSAKARLVFGSPGSPGPDAPAADATAAIKHEIVALEVLRGLRAGAWPRQRVAEAVERLGIESGPAQAVSSVLWHAVLWELVVEIDHLGAAELIAECWIPEHHPVSGKVGVSASVASLRAWRRELEDLGGLRGYSRAASPDIQVNSGRLRLLTRFAVLTLSPWLNRRTPSGAPPGTPWFPRGKDGLVLLRLFTSVIVALRLLRTSELPATARDRLVALVLHGADVMLDLPHKQYLTNLLHRNESDNPPSMAAPLAALAVHAKSASDLAGRGSYRAVEPKWFVDFAAPEEKPEQLARQEALLRGVPAAAVLVNWVIDAMSGAVPGDTDSLVGRWRAPVGEAGGKTLAEWAMDHCLALNRTRVGPASRPAAVLRAYLGSEAMARAELRSWHESSTPEEVQSVWHAVATSWAGAPEWLGMSGSALRHKAPAVLRALTTERLLAVFGDPEAQNWPEVEAWAEEWRQAHASVKEVRELSRVARMRMIDLLACRLRGEDTQRRVLEEVIDIELEFGLGTPTDRWMLFDHLSTGSVLPEQLTQVLRMRLLRGIYHRASVKAVRNFGQSPWIVVNQQKLDALLDRLLQTFVVSTRDINAEGADRRRVSDAIPDLWLDAHRARELVVRNVPLSIGQQKENVDARRLVGVAVDRVHDSAQFYAVRAPKKPKGLLDPHTVPNGEVVRRLTGSRAPVYGVVSGVDGTSVWVNCGLREPVHTTWTGDQPLEVGDQVAVPLVKAMHPPFRVDGRLTRLDGEARTGDVRSAEVTADRGADGHWRLRVTLSAGHVADSTPWDVNRAGTAALQRWDPDVLRSFTEWDHGVVHTVARWDGTIWLPVDWGMPELLATDAIDATADQPVRLVLVDDLLHEAAVRCCTKPGRAFVIPFAAWSRDDEATLREAVAEHGPLGLVVHAAVDLFDGRPRLRLVPDPASGRLVCTRNARWRNHFTAGDQYWAERRPDGSWVAESDTADMPRVVVNGLLGAANRGTWFTVRTWEDHEQRSGQVVGDKAQTHELRPRRTVGEFRRIVDLEERDRLRLRATAVGALHGVVRGYTEEGLPVDVEAESLTCEPITQDWRQDGLVRGRVVVVTNIGLRRARRTTGEIVPLSGREFLRGVNSNDHTVAEDFLVRARTMKGLVISVPRERQDDGLDQYAVCFEAQDAIFAADVPHTAFEHPPVKVGSLVSAVLTNNGWVFTATTRFVRVRALWEFRDESTPDNRTLPLGIIPWRGRPTMLLQSRTEPVVHLVPAEAGAEVEHLSGWRAGQARFELHGGVVEPTRTFEGECQRVVVVAQVNGRPALLAGETRQLNPTRNARATGVTVRITRFDAGLVEIQRLFTLDEARGRREQQRPADADPLAGYRKYLAGPRPPLNASVEGSAVRLKESWQVPVGHQPVSRVPLREGERPWVDFKYDAPAWVVLVGEEGDQRASYRDVPPVPLERFVTEFERQGLVLGVRSELRTLLRYVDRRTSSSGAVVHRFEWGYGKVVQVADGDLTIDGARLTARSSVLFHGDVVSEVEVKVSRSGRYRMDISAQHLEWGWHSWIYNEARQGTVHLAEVEPEAGGEQLRIVRLHTRDPQRWRQGQRHQESTTVRMHRARISDRTKKLIVDAWREANGARQDQKNAMFALISLDSDSFVACGGSEVLFDFLRPDQLPEGSRVFMTAAGIHAMTNDVALSLELGHVLGESRGRQLTASVKKRDFSARSELLSDIYRAELQSRSPHRHLRGSVYLVKLDSIRGTTAQGKIRDALARRPKALISMLRNADAPCLATVSRQRSREDGLRIEFEVEPNVVFRLRPDEIAGAVDLPSGSVVRLSFENGHVAVRTALVGDSAYLPAAGRPVVLLPMNSAVSKNDTFAQAVARGAYSVAGLPSVVLPVAAAQNGATSSERRLITSAHPKIAWIRPADGGGPKAALAENEVLAGTVSFDSTGAAVVHELGNDARRSIRLSQLSYLDGGADAVRRRVNKLGWTYHDTTTTHRDPAQPDQVVQPVTQLPLPARLTEEPAFFSRGWTLRHRQDELVSFGYPAAGFIQHLTRRGTDMMVPVAGVSRQFDGVWVEQAPGRLVHLVEGMLTTRVGNSRVPLEGFAWEHLAPGDRLILSAKVASATEIASVELRGWRPGLRAALGKRALLPVADVNAETGTVRLGQGCWHLDHALDPGAAPPAGTVWLDDTNCLALAGDRPQIERHDVVLLVENDGELEVVGAPGTEVRLAERSWARWMREALSDRPGRERLLALCGGALPATVEGRTRDAITVSRRLQRDFVPLERGQVVPVQPIGMLDGQNVLLRRGARLARCRVTDLVPGLPPAVFESSVARLRDIQELLWCHADAEGRLRFGYPNEAAGPGQNETLLRPVALIDENGQRGVLCWDRNHCRPRWLPRYAIGWTELANEEIEQHVVGVKGDVTARILPSGTVTLVGRAVNEQRVRNIHAGAAVQVEVVTSDCTPLTDKNVRFLARLYMSDMLLRLDLPADGEPPEIGDVLRCEVDQVRKENDVLSVVVTAPGNRTVPVDLPSWMFEPRPITPPPWYTGDDGTHQELLEAVRENDQERLRTAMLAWLEVHGRNALHQTDEATLDAVPLLAAVLAADALGKNEFDGAESCRDLAVRLCRHLGLRATRSRHVEPILTRWLARQPAVPFDNLWLRLDWMTLAAEISVAQRNEIQAIDQGIRARTAVRSGEHLNAVSGSLTAAVGLPVNYDEIAELSRELGVLSGLARALAPHPTAGKPAQRRLLPVQRTRLRDMLDLLVAKPPMFVCDTMMRSQHRSGDDVNVLNQTIAALRRDPS
ncbi:hypothetical protein C8D87_1206 [Lentzea atacamensis]|uniref:S1 motif domain-containing protein n=1 Tax=Lentzea atacamensis TaxID=531938 RepID=A0ABX9DUF1_9PSEU|nr:hypothetical protein [Lentzea atacamensis]RAS57883.1 hypothetical protein C8D87_1206 [Lentzea atacamensis]